MPNTNTTTLDAIRAHDPCATGWKKLLTGLGKTEADNEPLELSEILRINGIKDAIWALRALGPEQQGEIWLFAAAVTELVLPIWEQKYPDDLRPRNAIETARRYVRGEATAEELAAARAAAEASAESSARAARTAARAAEAARDAQAAQAAAWDAEAAEAAAQAAWAAEAAADAAWASAWAAQAARAARTAAWDAAQAAAWAARAADAYNTSGGTTTKAVWNDIEHLYITYFCT